MNKELINRIRENKYLTKNETNFIVKALEENSSLLEQVNMWQSEHAKRVLELGRMHENIKKAREEIEKKVHEYSGSGNEVTQAYCNGLKDSLAILDKLIESEDKE